MFDEQFPLLKDNEMPSPKMWNEVALFIRGLQSRSELQSMGHDVEADEYSANDENGNTAVITHINHRLKISVTAKIPTNVSIPIPGQIVKVAGIVLPTVDEHGVVTGSFKIDKTQTTKYDFVVTGNPNVTESNSDYNNCTFELTRYLVNGLPGAGSDSN